MQNLCVWMEDPAKWFDQERSGQHLVSFLFWLQIQRHPAGLCAEHPRGEAAPCNRQVGETQWAVVTLSGSAGCSGHRALKERSLRAGGPRMGPLCLTLCSWAAGSWSLAGAATALSTLAGGCLPCQGQSDETGTLVHLDEVLLPVGGASGLLS